MLPWETELAGRLDRNVIISEFLNGNPLGDPYDRPLRVYVPRVTTTTSVFDIQ
jgi:hypothetical protein